MAALSVPNVRVVHWVVRYTKFFEDVKTGSRRGKERERKRERTVPDGEEGVTTEVNSGRRQKTDGEGKGGTAEERGGFPTNREGRTWLGSPS